MIKIDQIRALEEFVFVASHRAGRRVILILQAESMNAPAANALLKILEEPPSGVHFILVSSRPRTLLPTIRSRCRTLGFSCPDESSSNEWLNRAGLTVSERRFLSVGGGAPMKVIAWKEQGLLAPIEAVLDTLMRPSGDPLTLAARWDSLLKADTGFTTEHLVEAVQRWLFDVCVLAMGGARRYHTAWNLTAPSGSNIPLIQAWREMLRFKRAARHPLNQLLFLEDLAMLVSRVTSPAMQSTRSPR